MNTAIVVLFFNLIFLFMKWDAGAAEQIDEIVENLESRNQTVNVVTGECLGYDSGNVITEYYEEGEHFGKVKRQLVIVDETGELVPVSRFVYHKNRTEVYDVFDRKSVFRFSDNSLITSIESYDSDGNPINKENFEWEGHQLIHRTVEDGGGKTIGSQNFVYDQDGNVIEVSNPEVLPPDQEIEAHNSFPLPSFVEMVETFFGRMYLIMAGYYDHPLESGVCGKGEISDKVRVTFINGILNLSNDAIETSEMISKTHGGVNVHYVYRPTDGWAGDMINSAMVKLGYLTPQAELLANRWKELIAEMGGPESGGTIIHYAHSVGGSDTWNARTLMTPEEKKMIRVVTIGSPFMIHKDGLHSVVNYVSVRDGVCMLDPVGYLRGHFSKDSNVIFCGTWWGIPFIDHEIASKAYSGVIEHLGKEFVRSYGYVGN